MVFLANEDIAAPRTPRGVQTAIGYLSELYSKPLQKYIELLYEDSIKAQKFCSVIICVAETCHDVVTLNLDTHGDLDAEHIKEASLIYQQTVLEHTYNFLMEERPTAKQKADFKKALYAAEQEFRRDALGTKLDSSRRAMKFSTNFILHISVIGICANLAHKAKTGNYLFFNYNLPTNIIRDMRRTIVDNLDSPKEINFLLR